MSTSLTLIDRRKRMANMNTSSVNRPNIDNIKSPISLNTMETFLSNINNNVDINFLVHRSLINIQYLQMIIKINQIN